MVATLSKTVEEIWIDVTNASAQTPEWVRPQVIAVAIETVQKMVAKHV